MYWSRIAEYSSWPAVSRMSSKHVSSSIVTCLRYESSIVGSYSSMKWFWISWMVSADLPTPPPPTMTSLYSVILMLLRPEKNPARRGRGVE